MACKKFPALFNLSLLFFLLSNRLVIGPPLLLLPGWKAGVFGGSGMLEMMLQFDISLWSGCWSTRWKKLVSLASFRMVELKLFLSKFLLGKFWFLFAVSHKFSYGDLIFCLWKRGQNRPSPDIYLKIDYRFQNFTPQSTIFIFLAVFSLQAWPSVRPRSRGGIFPNFFGVARQLGWQPDFGRHFGSFFRRRRHLSTWNVNGDFFFAIFWLLGGSGGVWLGRLGVESGSKNFRRLLGKTSAGACLEATRNLAKSSRRSFKAWYTAALVFLAKIGLVASGERLASPWKEGGRKTNLWMVNLFFLFFVFP